MYVFINKFNDLCETLELGATHLYKKQCLKIYGSKIYKNINNIKIVPINV